MMQISDDLSRRIEEALLDGAIMIGTEVSYLETGKSYGPPMREVRGQWKTLAKNMAHLASELQKYRPFSAPPFSMSSQPGVTYSPRTIEQIADATGGLPVLDEDQLTAKCEEWMHHGHR